LIGGFYQVFWWGSRNNSASSFFFFFFFDTLISREANQEELCNLCGLFLCFEAVSGLKINLSKSKIIPSGEVDDVESLASIFGCRVALLQMTYLGHPLGASYKSTSMGCHDGFRCHW
jgi:hypothetical protein